ncbi:MAG: hypothetical protein OXF79_04635 [Chloroflexi bacterium]|nr:hypothetical protein [Chloroflexota bacterium]
MNLKTRISAAAAALVLSACGGGGQTTGLDVAPAYTPSVFTPDTIIASSILVHMDGSDVRIPVDCTGSVCRYEFAGEAEVVDVGEMLEIDAEGEAPEVSERLYGIGLSEEDVDEFLLDDIGATFLGAWMESSAFFVAGIEVDAAELGDMSLGFAVALGDSPGTTPAARGGGTWNGAMVGVDTEESETVKGHAAIRIRDFSNPAVDVAFTRVRAPSGPRDDMTWTGLSLEGGTFTASSIHGTFFGDRHTEVAGTFDRNRVVGAFGARRSD